MNFQEAEARFQWLESQRRSGALNEQQYHAALCELRVTDPWGRLWMPQEHTGKWHLYQNGQWIPAAPPVSAPPPPQAVSPSYQAPSYNPQPQASPVPGMQAPRPQPAQPESAGCLKPFLILLGTAVFWAIVAIVVYLIWGQEEPMVMAGLGMAALLSFILMLISMAQSWKGQIIDIKTERVRVDDDEGDWHWENQTFAYIRQTNGRTRKMRALRKWQVGDWLEKRRGETQIRKL